MVTIALLALVGLATISVTTFYTELRRGLRYASAPPGFRPLTIAEAAAFAASALGSLVAATACRLIPGLGHARRRQWGIERTFSRDDTRTAARDATPFSCPRCRAASRGPNGFCNDCLAQLDPWAVDANAPIVRAAVSVDRTTVPELIALRRTKIVRGSIGGWACLVSAAQEGAFDAPTTRELTEARGEPLQAWRDPDDAERLWVCLWSRYELASGRVFEGRTITLAFYAGGQLAALWVMSPFEWREENTGVPAGGEELLPGELA